MLEQAICRKKVKGRFENNPGPAIEKPKAPGKGPGWQSPSQCSWAPVRGWEGTKRPFKKKKKKKKKKKRAPMDLKTQGPKTQGEPPIFKRGPPPPRGEPPPFFFPFFRGG
eukprot:FR735792.1.p7 GENE.FR735792.1~~FR735792.1.p7  ORF type:complete len:110 (+),score=82.63 FR735792.1:827-1156(+)